MTTLTLTDPVNGQVADANQIASNNSAIKTVINGGIDNSNVATSAGIAISKLASAVFQINEGSTAHPQLVKIGRKTASNDGSGNVTVTYSAAFPTATDFVYVVNASGATDPFFRVGTVTASSFVAFFNVGIVHAQDFYWLAIGH